MRCQVCAKVAELGVTEMSDASNGINLEQFLSDACTECVWSGTIQIPHECVLLAMALKTYHQRVAVAAMVGREHARMVFTLVFGMLIFINLKTRNGTCRSFCSSLKAQIAHKALEKVTVNHYTMKQYGKHRI